MLFRRWSHAADLVWLSPGIAAGVSNPVVEVARSPWHQDDGLRLQVEQLEHPVAHIGCLRIPGAWSQEGLRVQLNPAAAASELHLHPERRGVQILRAQQPKAIAGQLRICAVIPAAQLTIVRSAQPPTGKTPNDRQPRRCIIVRYTAWPDSKTSSGPSRTAFVVRHQVVRSRVAIAKNTACPCRW